jgi:hypothetical protein
MLALSQCQPGVERGRPVSHRIRPPGQRVGPGRSYAWSPQFSRRFLPGLSESGSCMRTKSRRGRRGARTVGTRKSLRSAIDGRARETRRHGALILWRAPATVPSGPSRSPPTAPSPQCSGAGTDCRLVVGTLAQGGAVARDRHRLIPPYAAMGPVAMYHSPDAVRAPRPGRATVRTSRRNGTGHPPDGATSGSSTTCTRVRGGGPEYSGESGADGPATTAGGE